MPEECECHPNAGNGESEGRQIDYDRQQFEHSDSICQPWGGDGKKDPSHLSAVLGWPAQKGAYYEDRTCQYQHIRIGRMNPEPKSIAGIQQDKVIFKSEFLMGPKQLMTVICPNDDGCDQGNNEQRDQTQARNPVFSPCVFQGE